MMSKLNHETETPVSPAEDNQVADPPNETQVADAENGIITCPIEEYPIADVQASTTMADIQAMTDAAAASLDLNGDSDTDIDDVDLENAFKAQEEARAREVLDLQTRLAAAEQREHQYLKNLKTSASATVNGNTQPPRVPPAPTPGPATSLTPEMLTILNELR
ncbi:hypothetical protein KEM56_006299 [Ascosphaera pollenicola]|nr:hypothetical protein KEM56_006299 [Ascosphaera pollenicola]